VAKKETMQDQQIILKNIRNQYDRIGVRFGIALTYRCNDKCPGCNRYLDIQKWPDSDVTLSGLEEGYRRVVASNIQVEKTRVTGGEPLLHPQFVKAMELIGRTWNKDYDVRTAVFTNGRIDFPKPTNGGWRYNSSAKKGKFDGFRSPTVSPEDVGLGLEIVNGVDRDCSVQKGCGRLFDAFGFAPCILSGPIGHLLGIDPYSSQPVLRGNPEICKHCPYSLRSKSRWELFEKGKTCGSTKTFQRAIEGAKKKELIRFTRFEDRS